MDITIHYTFLPHTDAEAALGFYRDILGFEVRQDVGYEEMRWITVGPPQQTGTSIVLHPPASDPSITDDERRLILELIAKGVYGAVTLATDDLDGLFERLEAAGADVVQEPIDQDYGVRDCAFRDPAVRERIPDPNAPHSLEASRLQWSERGRSPHREREALVRELLAIRRRRLAPRLAGMRGGGRFSVDGGLLSLRWTLGDRSALTQLANFGRGDAAIDGAAPGERLFEHGVVRDREGGARLARGGIRVALGEARDG